MAHAAPRPAGTAAVATRPTTSLAALLLWSSLITAVALLTGCGAAGPTPSTTTSAQAQQIADVRLVSSDKPRSAAAAPAADIEELVLDDTDFALDLFVELTRLDGPAAGENVVISPYSISTALAMTYAGARQRTADEMAAALHFTLSDERLHPAFNAIDRAVASRARELPPRAEGGKPERIEIRTVNQLWGQSGYELLPSFLDLLAAEYGAGLRLVDFGSDPDGARRAVNEWVSDETEARIDELLPPGSIDDQVRLILTNAIYLKAPWELPFDPEATSDGDFRLPDGATATVPFMHQSESFGFAEGEGWRAAEIPYRGGELSMVIVVPETGDPAGFAAGLDAAALQAMLAELTPEQLELSLPRFQARSDLDLIPALQALGMKEAFSLTADFSGMTGKPDLYVSGVYHDGFVSVDEAGTEAAAATAVVMRLKSAFATKAFAIDRPFLWLIRDVETGAVLFLGQVVDPSTESAG